MEKQKCIFRTNRFLWVDVSDKASVPSAHESLCIWLVFTVMLLSSCRTVASRCLILSLWSSYSHSQLFRSSEEQASTCLAGERILLKWFIVLILILFFVLLCFSCISIQRYIQLYNNSWVRYSELSTNSKLIFVQRQFVCQQKTDKLRVSHVRKSKHTHTPLCAPLIEF